MFPLLIVAAALLLALIYLAQQFARPRPLPYFPHLNSTHWLQGDFPLALQSFMATGQFALYFEKIYERLGSRTYQFFFRATEAGPRSSSATRLPSSSVSSPSRTSRSYFL